MPGPRFSLRAARPALLLVSVLLQAGAAPAAASDRPEQYDALAPVRLASGEALQRLELPLAVLQASRSPNHADVRLFDAQGQPVPQAWARPQPAPRGERREAVPRFAWPATPAPDAGAASVQIGRDGNVLRIEAGRTPAPPPLPADGSASRWLLDLSAWATAGDGAAPQRPTRLTLDWRARDGGVATGVRLEGSDDARHWQPLGQASLLDLARSGAPTLKHLDWPVGAALPRYLRLDFDLPLALTRSDLHLSTQAPPPALRLQDLVFSAQDGGDGEPRPWVLDLRGPVPLARLQLHLPQTNTVLPLKLQQRDDAAAPWRTVATLVAWRLTRDGHDVHSPPVDLEAPAARHWQLVPDVRASGSWIAQLPATIGWRPLQLVFVARGAPTGEAAASAAGASPAPSWQLAVGRANQAPAPWRLDDLMPGHALGDEHRLPEATLGALVAQPRPDTAWWTAWRDASPAERQRWTLWAVLSVAVAGLGGLAWRLGRELRRAGSDVSGPDAAQR